MSQPVMFDELPANPDEAAAPPPEPLPQPGKPLTLGTQLQEPAGMAEVIDRTPTAVDVPQLRPRNLSPETAGRETALDNAFTGKGVMFDDLPEATPEDPPPDAEVRGNILKWVAENHDVPAAKQAEILKYSAASGIPVEVVAAGLDDVKRQVDAQQVDWQEMARQSPALAEFLVEQPQSMPVLRADVHRLGLLEAALGKWELADDSSLYAMGKDEQGISIGPLRMTRPPEWVKAFQGAMAGQEATYLQGKKALPTNWEQGTLDVHLTPPIPGVQQITLDIPYPRIASGDGTPADERRLEELRAEEEKANAWVNGIESTAVRTVAKVALGPFKLAPFIAGNAAAVAVGGPAGVAAFNVEQFYGPGYEAINSTTGADGEKINPTLAKALAVAVTPIEAALAVVGVGPLARAVAGPALEKSGAVALKEVLAQPSLLRSLGASALTSGKELALGATSMAWISALNEGARQVGANLSLGHELDAGAIGQTMVDTFKSMVLDMGALTLFGGGRQFLHERGQQVAAQQSTARLQAMVEAAKASTTLDHSPEQFEAVVGRMKGEDGKPQHIYIPAEQWVSYWQEKKVDPAQVAENLVPGGGKALETALATKGDFAIPAEKYLAKLGKTEHIDGLAPDAKLSADDFTPRQAKADQERIQARMEAAANERGDELERGKKEVLVAVRDQAIAAGIDKAEAQANAKLVSEYAGTMALRLGVSVREAADLGALGQLRILGPKGKEIGDAVREKFRAFLAPDASKLLQERLATLSPENRAREIYLDPGVGLLNERGFNEHPSEKPLVAQIGVEGVKYVNDNASHDVGDRLYSAVAKALHDIDPTAAKVGGDFAIRVADQSELDQVLEKVNAALPVKGFAVTGALGADFKSAGEAHVQLKAEAEKAGLRAERGKKPLGLQGELADTAFPAERARAEVPGPLADRVKGLSDADYFHEAYVEPKTGLLTGAGWSAIPRKEHVAAFDLRGLKKVNEALGSEAGDAMIEQFGVIASTFGGSSFDFAHLHGDEYAAQGDDPAKLAQFIASLEERAAAHPLVAEHPESGERVKLKVSFRYGLGEQSYEAADRDLNARKQADANNLARGSSGDSEGARSVQEREVDDRRGEPTRPLDSQRGARPQAYPGAERAALLNQEVAGRGAETIGHIEGKPITFEQPAGPGDPRGQIQIQLDPSGHPTSFDINVLRGDRSTFAHETAHFLSWSLHDLATSHLATPELRADYDKLLTWAGYDSPEQRLSETKERSTLEPGAEARRAELTAKEERFSHAWEQYLLEGKAPSKALANVFSRFRGWLLRIYKGVPQIEQQFRANYGEELGMTDEIRGVFDRLLAQDEALSRARETTGGDDTPSWVTERMDPAEREAHRKAKAAAQVTAEEQVGARTRAQQAGVDVSEARAKITAEVTQSVDSLPIYRSLRFLQRGEAVDAEGRPLEKVPDHLLDAEGRPLKVDRKAFLAEYGPDQARLMPREMFAPAGEGVEIDELAARLGWESGDQLVREAAKSEPRDQMIAREVQAGVDLEQGPAVQQLQTDAMVAVHNADEAHAQLLELRALARQLDPAAANRARNLDLGELRATARRIVSETSVGDLDPAHYARAERRAALQAAELWGKGKKQDAYDHREARLLHQLLFSAAHEAQESLDKARSRLENTSEAVRANLGKADPVYRDLNDQLLAAVGLGEKAAGDRTLDQLIQVATDDGETVDFDVEAARQLLATPKEWDSLKVDEARNLVDAITNIRHIARRSLEVTIAGKTFGKEAFLQQLADRAAQSREAIRLMPPGQTAQRSWDTLRGHARGVSARFENIETFAHILDGGDAGPFHDLLVDSRLEARDKEVELTKKVLVKVRELFSKMPKEVLKRRAEEVDLGGTKLIPGRFAPIYTRDQLWSLFLNSGNDGNLQRLRDGNKLDDSARQKALNLLTKPETDFLQGVLDTVQSLYPDLAAAHERRTGLPLGKVEATPITVNGETYPGGYYPLKYRSEARQGQAQDINAIKDLFPSNTPPAPQRSHTKARVEKVSAPVDLEWSTLQAHLANVIHDISYGDWVRQTGRIALKPRAATGAPSFSETATAHVGIERERQILPWLRDVASARADSSSQHVADALDKVGGFARRRMALGVMGFNFPVLGRHSLDAFRSVLEKEAVPPQTVANAYRLVMNPGNWSLPEFAKSKEIAYHEAKHAENLRLELQRIGGTWGTVEKFDDAIAHVAFGAQLKLDAFTSRATFKAAYDHAIDSGLLPEAAVKRADDVLRRAFPSGDIAEKPPIMRTKSGWGSALMFMGWANSSYNAYARLGHDTLTALGTDVPFSSKGAKVASVAAQVLALGMIEALGMYLAGRGPKQDDDAKERALWVGEEALLAPVDTVPVAGPLLKKAITGHQINPTVDPSMALAADYATKVQNLLHKRSEGKRLTGEELLFEALEGAGTALGLGGFSRRTIGGAGKMATGEARPRGPIDAAGKLLYGAKKDPAATPLSDLSKALEQ